jgi:TP901 family phage tail tape measure protein
MATSQSVIDIIINGIDRATPTFGNISARLSSFNDDLSKVGGGLTAVAEPFSAVADGFLAIETVSLAAGAALVGFAVNSADQFDRAFREIVTLIDQPIEGLQNFRKEILDYAATSTQSLDQVTNAVYNAVSQGVAYTDSLKAVSAAEKLAVAGKADLNGTLQALLGTLNAYGKGMDSAAEFSDVFFKTVQLGKTTVPELAASLSGVTSTATLGGVSFQELGAAIATITSAGAGTSEAITRINAVLSAIIKPSGEAAKLAESLGIEFDVQALKAKGLSGVLADVAIKTGGAGDKMAVLFGSTEALNAANVLAVTSSGKFKDNLEAMANASGATQTAFDKMKDSTDTFAQALTVAAVKLGTPLLEPLNRAEDAIAAIGVALAQSIDTGKLGGVQDRLTAFANSVADVFEAIARNLPAALEGVDFSPLVTSMSDLGDAVGTLWDAFSGGIDLTTVAGLQRALQLLVNSGAAVTEVVSGIIRAFEPFAAAAGRAVSNFQDLDRASQIEFGEFLGAMKSIVVAGPGVGSALLAIGRAGLDVGTVLDGVFGGVKVLINSVQVSFDLLAIGVVKTAQAIASVALGINKALGKDQAVAEIEKGLRGLDELSKGIQTNLERNAKELREGWTQAAGGASEKTEQFRAKLDALETSLKTNAGAQKDSGDAARESVKDYDGILAKLNQIDPAATGATRAISDLGDAQKNLILKGDATFADEPIKNLIKTWDENGVPTYKAVEGAVIKATGAFADMTGQVKAQAAATKEAAKDTLEFKAKMEELASNERIKTIEANVKLNVAAFEADAKRVEAAFASIDNTISSTGDLLGGLFGQLSDADFHARNLLERQIALENERRQQALDLQKKLTEAEIERIRAQTAALDRADGLIKIEAAGLEPELEAFLWKILQKIQVRANASFTDYLLGLPTVGAPA